MRVEELEHLDGRRRRADVDRDGLVESEHRPQVREHLGVGLGDGLLELLGNRLAALQQSHALDCGFERRLDGGPLLLGSPACIASSPALSFSQMRGTAKNHVGRTCGR